MPADDVAQGEHIDGKQGGAEDRPLRHSTDDGVGPRPGSPQGHILSSISQVGPKPLECCVCDANEMLQTVKKNGVINSVEGG